MRGHVWWLRFGNLLWKYVVCCAREAERRGKKQPQPRRVIVVSIPSGITTARTAAVLCNAADCRSAYSDTRPVRSSEPVAFNCLLFLVFQLFLVQPEHVCERVASSAPSQLKCSVRLFAERAVDRFVIARNTI